MSANTLASALAAALEKSSGLSPAAGIQATRATLPPPAPVRQPAAPTPLELSDVDALMIAVQRSAGTVDNIVTRRMLLASGCWGQPRTK